MNGYPILVFLWYIGVVNWESSYLVLGAMPSLAAWSMFSPRTVQQASEIVTTSGGRSLGDWIPVGFGLILVLIYAVTALALTWRIVRRFDRWLDRPPLTKESRPHPSSDTDPEGSGGRMKAYLAQVPIIRDLPGQGVLE